MIRRFAALVVVLGTTLLIRRLGGPTEIEIASIGLGLGFALIAAGLVGQLFERVRLPRVTGYLLFGMVCGPYVANIISRPMARGLQLMNGLAVVLIAFVAGLELNVAQLRGAAGALIRYTLVMLAALFFGLFVVLAAIWPWLGIEPGAAWPARLALAALAALLIASLSPTVTIAVIAEVRAKGRFTDFVMAVTILADLVLIVAFTVLTQLVRWAVAAQIEADVGLMTRLTWEIAGSLAFGALAGSIFTLYLRTVGREVTVVLVGLCVLLSAVSGRFHLERTLSALMAGLVVENIAPPRGVALRDAVERGALPILVVFFAATGASLQLDAVAAAGALTLVLAATRLALLVGGTRLAARAAEGVSPHPPLVWMALVSQAGITLGLAAIVAAEFPGWGQSMQSLVVALTALHVLVGPVLLRAALTRSGDAGRMTAESI